jgi:hypothetical protein
VELEKVRLTGIRPVASGALEQSFAQSPAQLPIAGPRVPASALQISQRVISPNVLGIAIIPHVNQNLKNRQSTCAAGEFSRYKACDAKEWWLFFAIMLSDRLKKQGKAEGITENMTKSLCSLISPHRVTALKVAHSFTEEQMKTLAETLRKNLRTLVALGNFALVDETLIAYRGNDMRKLRIDVCIPHKPHAYGMLRYGIVQVFLYSGAPILIDSDTRLPSHKISGSDALVLLTQRNFPDCSRDVHIYADSLFCGTTQVANFRNTGVRLSVSFGENAAADLVLLRQHCLPFLGIGVSLTYSTSRHQIQITGGAQAPTCVITNYWRLAAAHPAPPIDAEKHTIALALFQCSASDGAIREVLGIAPADGQGSRAEFLSRHFGVTLWLPPAGPQGLVLTEANLDSMPKALLQILHNRTPGCSGGSRLKKAELIANILQHSPLTGERGNLQEWRAAQQSIEAVQKIVLGSPHTVTNATHLYQRYYGLLDRHDRYLYENFGTSYLETWNSCLVFTCLFQQVINAYSIYWEQHSRAQDRPHLANAASPDDGAPCTCAGYVVKVIGSICTENE